MNHFFGHDYAEARSLFLAQVEAAGLRAESHRNPVNGPNGEALFCDTVQIGDPDARQWFVGVSATHGAEGFAGSAAQTAWLNGRVTPPKGVGVLLVHALNPFGFAHLARVNEDNIDLNRNHLDYTQPLPQNPLYAEIADALVPRQWDSDQRAAADQKIAAFTERHGPGAVLRACAGQYDHPDGIFYGGTGATWSNRVLTETMQRHAAQAELISYVDFHTGLGPYGFGEAICYHAPGTPAYTFAREAFGAGVTTPHLGTAASPLNTGKTGYGVQMAVPKATVSCMTLEFGTADFATVLNTIRADAWLRKYGDTKSAAARQIKADLRRAFYPDEDNWRQSVVTRCLEIIAQALTALSKQ